MKETTRVLIPMDGSAFGDAVLMAIHPLVRSRNVEVTLLHVSESRDRTEEEAEHRLDFHRKALQGDGIRTRVRMVSGRPAEEILREASIGQLDLIAMATHGRTGMDRVTIGSVAEEVVRSSPIPTLLCRNRVRIGGWERIVVALDGTPGSEEILGDAVRLARSLGSTLHLIQVGLGLLRTDGYRGVTLHTAAEDPTAYLEETAAKLLAEGLPVIPERREGMAAVEIPILAQQLDAGLICMATEGRPDLVPGLNRSVAADVIHTAPCPVYVRRMSAGAGTRGDLGKAAGHCSGAFGA
jgi:nucleotide-binding universal stress UspA family protein